jgi:tetratricopeptide (TPR) repeat protein
MLKFFRKQKTVETPVISDPTQISDPQTASEFLKRGWAYFTKGQYSQAEKDFRQAMQLEPENLDVIYALGLALKMLGEKEESVKTFRRVVQVLEQSTGDAEDGEDVVRKMMIRRLALGYVNALTKGDWDLEEEVWRKRIR